MSALDSTVGQAAIAVRHAFADGDAARALASVDLLDRAHALEVLLGAAIRDRRGGFAAVRAWYAGDLPGLCGVLATAPDTALDDAAVALIVERKVDERWRPGGREVGDRLARSVLVPDAAVQEAAEALRHGVGGLALVEALRDRFLYAAVRQYYVEGTIHALGVRPLLILAASPVERPGVEGAG